MHRTLLLLCFACLLAKTVSKMWHHKHRRKEDYAVRSPTSLEKPPLNGLLLSTPLYRSQCKYIPEDFGLCHGMEYGMMRLPNLLGHETMMEVKRQARSWPPLVSNGCHPETRKFLCTLYAPVCMGGFPAPIPPCRGLCYSVRDACLPTMRMFGFSWPQIFNCSKFPNGDAADKLCVPGEEAMVRDELKQCRPCRHRSSLSIMKRICTFDFVMKVRVRRLEFYKGGTRILTQERSKKIFRWSGSARHRSWLWLRDGLHCTCNVIRNTKRRHLVTGWRIGKDLVLHSVSRWSKRHRKMIKKLKRKKKCEIL